MSALYLLLAFLVIQRLGEVAWARRNTRRLLARGAVEAGAAHYPLFVLLHTGWLAAMALLIPPHAPMAVGWFAVFVFLQAARLWIIATLGPYWTTRIITLPAAPLVRRGPYRLVRHPNYLVVALEVPVVPLIFGAWEIALAFGTANLALLAHRIRIEDAALHSRSAQQAL